MIWHLKNIFSFLTVWFLKMDHHDRLWARNLKTALVRWLSWLEYRPIPRGCGFDTWSGWLGHIREATMSLSLSSFHPLKINKKIIFSVRIKKKEIWKKRLLGKVWKLLFKILFVLFPFIFNLKTFWITSELYLFLPQYYWDIIDM